MKQWTHAPTTGWFKFTLAPSQWRLWHWHFCERDKEGAVKKEREKNKVNKSNNLFAMVVCSDIFVSLPFFPCFRMKCDGNSKRHQYLRKGLALSTWHFFRFPVEMLLCNEKKIPRIPTSQWYNAFWLLMWAESYIRLLCCVFFGFLLLENTKHFIFSKCVSSTRQRIPQNKPTKYCFQQHKWNKLFKHVALTFNFEWYWVMNRTCQVVWESSTFADTCNLQTHGQCYKENN